MPIFTNADYVLLALHEAGPLTPTQLAAELDLSPDALNQVLVDPALRARLGWDSRGTYFAMDVPATLLPEPLDLILTPAARAYLAAPENSPLL